MARVLKPMTQAEYENALQFVDITIKSLVTVVNSERVSEDQVERAYGLLAEAVITKARLTSIGANYD